MLIATKAQRDTVIKYGKSWQHSRTLLLGTEGGLAL